MKSILVTLITLAGFAAQAGTVESTPEQVTFGIFTCAKLNGKPARFPLTVMLDTAKTFGAKPSDFDEPINGRVYYQYQTGAIFGDFVTVKINQKNGSATVVDKTTKEVVMTFNEGSTEATYGGDDYSDCEAIDPLSD